MCQVIAITNQKGGVGKTTTTFNLATKISRSVNLDKQVFNASSMKDPQHK